MMQFTDNDLEEKKELSNKHVASLKQKNHYFRGASHRDTASGL
jgi:hypothetical protein